MKFVAIAATFERSNPPQKERNSHPPLPVGKLLFASSTIRVDRWGKVAGLAANLDIASSLESRSIL
jgi:hypothetical protein